MWSSPRRYVWGTQDESEVPIRLTLRRYFEQYVYNKDYARAPQIAYNTISRGGNSINTLLETYPQAILVSYYFPPSNSPNTGMDWGGLWLVYERQGNEWYLVGIAHDEWTI